MPAHRLLTPAVRTTAGLGAGLVLTGCVVAGPADARPVATATTTEPETASTSAPAAPSADGTFSATGTYETPGGPQRIGVTVVLDGGVVQNLRVDPAATNQTSLRYQERFASAVVDAVVGRPLTEVEVDRVAGSSSTGAGFMEALDQVVRDATGA